MAMFGVEILMMLEARDRNEDFQRNFQAWMVSANPSLYTTLFPNAPDATGVWEKAKTPTGEYDIDKIDDALIEWRVPDSEEESRDLEQWLQEHQVGMATADDLAAQQQGGGWQ